MGFACRRHAILITPHKRNEVERSVGLLKLRVFNTLQKSIMIPKIRARHKLLYLFCYRLPTEELLKTNREDFGVLGNNNHIKWTCFGERGTTDFLYVRPSKSSVLTVSTRIHIGGSQGLHAI